MSTELRPDAKGDVINPEVSATLPAPAAPRRPPARRPPSGLPAVRTRPGLPARAFDAGSRMPALRQVGTPRTARKVGVLLMLAFVGLPFALALVPWRQSVYGDGKVIGFHPLDREFTIDAPIYGRVKEYYVNEGDEVRAGEAIASVENIDPDYLTTLQDQLQFYRLAYEQAKQQVTAYKAALDQKEAERDQAILEADSAILQSAQKIEETRQKLEEAKAEARANEIFYDQTRALYERGLEAGQKVLEAERKFVTSDRKRDQAEDLLEQVTHELDQYKAKRQVVEAKALAEIEKARTDMQGAEMKVQESQIKITDTEVKIRQQMQGGKVLAPRAGTVLRLLTNVGAGAYVKDGDPLAILVPETPRLAAELYLPGRDIPLVSAGDPVRIQFEGWPALQFIGWPAVAVGTFPAKVALVDRTETKQGKFRVLAVPDMSGPELNYDSLEGGSFAVGDSIRGLTSGAKATVVVVEPDSKTSGAGELTIGGITGEFRPDEPIVSSEGARAIARSPWPSREFLRQGARANGWVLLREVPLGFEIWRRLNGFAPVVADDESSAKDGAGGGKDDKPKVKRPK
jgi:biotin carboxyl carrier protein